MIYWRQTPGWLFRAWPVLALIPAALLLRVLNGFGNAGDPRLGGSLQAWLNLSKNTPSLAFVAFELGVIGLLLAGFSALAKTRTRPGVLGVFGKTALFFYVVHFPLLGMAVSVAGLRKASGIGGALAGALVLLAVMYPLCRWYGAYKATHDNLVTRYL